MIPPESLSTVSYSPSKVTMPLSPFDGRVFSRFGDICDNDDADEGWRKYSGLVYDAVYNTLYTLYKIIS